ncbi:MULTISPECIES: DUF4893 domain-containing protein [unclassified Brevundimonas]|uniref:DUF4893 domain-containing protein n=1 Tax=unclassified Brevundimonas TaxID=2622653 RepID=UPI0025C20006|nr:MULTISPECIES: DUF4893 domain-containing protein [unclassified Brevundimonas]
MSFPGAYSVKRGCVGVAVAIAAGVLAACASTGTVAPSPADAVAAPPPPPPPPNVSVLADWRSLITPMDRDRYQRREAAWTVALEQAHRLGGSGDLNALGALIDPDATLNDPLLPEGNYRCRTVKLGASSEDSDLGYVVYGWFACRITRTDEGLRLTKLTGSQRVQGIFYPENQTHMVLLGAMALANEARAPEYASRPDRDVVSVLERIGPQHWRVVTPWPQVESNLDILELVPSTSR